MFFLAGWLGHLVGLPCHANRVTRSLNDPDTHGIFHVLRNSYRILTQSKFLEAQDNLGTGYPPFI